MKVFRFSYFLDYIVKHPLPVFVNSNLTRLSPINTLRFQVFKIMASNSNLKNILFSAKNSYLPQVEKDIFASDSESDGQEEDCQLKPLKISFGSENDSLSKSNVSLTLPKGIENFLLSVILKTKEHKYLSKYLSL